MRRTVALGAVGLLAAGTAVVAIEVPSAGAAPSRPVVVVSGLNNPRQLALVGEDELLIAEAGRGGSTQVPGPPGEGPMFVGASGSISAVYLPQYARHTQPVRVVKGLMSGADSDGSFAVGSDGVAARGPHSRILIQETWAPPDALPQPFGTTQDGRLLSARPFGSHLRIEANITRFERRHDPDGHGFDSDPYAVLARAHDELVADAAGNDVLRVTARGIRVFHVFANVRSGPCATQNDPDPSHPGCNFVPTSLATDRQGHVYVGGLSSLVPGQARVVKLSADGKHVLRIWRHLTSVTGVAVDRRGALYVSQLFQPERHPVNPMVQGVLTRIGPHGHRTNVDVPFPAGVAVNAKLQVFVAAWSVAPAAGLGIPHSSGQVWRLNF